MSQLILLGGSGSVESNAVSTLDISDMFSEIKIADKNIEMAEEL